MCGIAGFVGQGPDELVRRMCATLVHRGPDEEGYYTQEPARLGMRRLSIIDLETGSQPIFNETGSVAVIFNGEIHNYRLLRKELLEAGHSFKTNSDTETIVHLYEELGLDFPKKLNGMFAIALWDVALRRLVLARDHVGIKPLYFADLEGRFLFASEIKAILKALSHTPPVNLEAVNDFFHFKHVPAPRTIFQGIHALQPGRILTFESGRIQIRTYWQPDYSRPLNSSEADILDDIGNRFEESVRLRMIADVDVGAYLSGGIDSSCVVAVMSRLMDRPLKTFTLGYADDFKNKEADVRFARRVSKMFGTEHHERIITAKDVEDDIGRIIESFDEPFAGVISTWFISSLIGRHVKVAISGDGADEIFGSYLSHRLAQPLHAIQRRKGGATLAPDDLKPFENRQEYLESIADADDASWRYKLCLFSDPELDRLYTPLLRSQIQSDRSLSEMKSAFDRLTAPDPLNRILEYEFSTLLPDQVLNFVDKLSMAHSVEVRPPFLDPEFVNYAARIPGHLKIRNGNVKAILKRLASRWLPEDLVNRPKEGFVMPINHWIMRELRPFISSVLAPQRIRAAGFLHETEVHRILNEHFEGKADHATRIWSLTTFQVWCDRYLGGKSL